MIKTFEVIYSIDNSYTGGGINMNQNWTQHIDEKINAFFSEIKIYKIKMYYPTFLSRKQQYGTDVRNTETIIYFIVQIEYEVQTDERETHPTRDWG